MFRVTLEVLPLDIVSIHSTSQLSIRIKNQHVFLHLSRQLLALLPGKEGKNTDSNSVVVVVGAGCAMLAGSGCWHSLLAATELL